jgi:type II secretory pathway pseudopilin PulG
MRQQLQQPFYRISRSEEGIALVLSIMVMMVVGALAGVAAASALEATDQSTQDRRVKQAISAADAGMDVSLYRLNKFASLLTSTVPCVVSAPATGILHGEVVLPDGWCRAQTEEMGGGASFTYRVSAPLRVDNPGQDVWQRKVIATGTAGGVRRRAAMIVNAPTGQALFADTVFSQEDLVLRNSARVNGNVRSDGNVNTQNSSIVCGNVIPGQGKQFLGGSQCSGFSSLPATEPFVLSPVVLPLTNDNLRIGNLDPWVDPGDIGWSPVSRVLTMSHSSTLTLTGGTYVFCRLELSHTAQLIVPDDGTPVRIYIDSPENCGGNAASVGLYNNSTILNPSGDPTMVQLYVAGSSNPSITTTVQLHNGHELQMVVYAPNSAISFDNQNRLRGAVAARRVSLDNNLEISADSRVNTLLVGDVPLTLYTRVSWVECVPSAPAAAPDSGC